MLFSFMPSTSMDPANKIITSYTALNNIITASNTSSDSTDTAISAQLNSTFILKEANSVGGFTSDLTKMGLNKYYTVSTNLDSIDQSLTPLKNLSFFARIFLLIVLGIGGVILVILNMINIRERKYEIGVLSAVGMKQNVSYVDQINAVVNGTVLLEILGIGILLTLFSSTVSVIFISRYEPLKILSNRA